MNTLTFAHIQHIGQEHADASPVIIAPEAYRASPAGRLVAQQGDLYFRKLDDLPLGAIPVTPYAQLAPGFTLGSRHCLASLSGVQMFHMARPGPLDGPIVLLTGPCTVTHPEHGHITFPAGACFQVTYQRLFGDTLRRVAD